MGTGTKVALGVVGVAALAGVAMAIKKGKRKNPGRRRRSRRR